MAAPRQVTLSSLAWLTFTSRPLLFLGCSLEQDSTFDVLEEIHDRLHGLRHYAVLATHHSLRRREQRARQLRAMGISPLWFAPGEFGQIEELLGDLVERTSTRLLSPPSRPAHPAPVEEEPEAGCGGSARPSVPPHGLTQTGDLARTTELIGRALGDGRLAISLERTPRWAASRSGNEFYNKQASKFRVPKLAGDRAAVAASIVSRHGKQALLQEMRAIMTRTGSGYRGWCILSWPRYPGSWERATARRRRPYGC